MPARCLAHGESPGKEYGDVDRILSLDARRPQHPHTLAVGNMPIAFVAKSLCRMET
jgi:hypothetical protein